MTSHMAVQSHATERNSQAELLVDFILRVFAEKLLQAKLISEFDPPKIQESFSRDDCRDVFDHYIELNLIQPIGGCVGRLQLWGQTTCYKGNATGRPEPNKTYEIRETLTEALGLRRWLRKEGASFRTLHFTLGPASYSYGWIKTAKDHAFDLSIYPSQSKGSFDVFAELARVLKGASSEFQIYQRFGQEMNDPESLIGHLIGTMSDHLYQWVVGGLNPSPIADKQADLLDRLTKMRQNQISQALIASKLGGENIKKRAQALLAGGETDDHAMIRTLKRVTAANPFLPIALEAERDWKKWSSFHFAVPNTGLDLNGYIRHLWNDPVGRLLNRRILLRVHSEEGVHYVQDTGIPGLTEHNLYGGDHTDDQIDAVVALISASCRASGLTTPEDLYIRLSSSRGFDLSKASRRLEVVNGTEMKPSFFYVEEALSDSFSFLAFRDTQLARPVAYYSSFGTGTVMPYQNMKVIVHKQSNRIIAIIKAKYFNKPEFSRRAKEEAYVGLTTKFLYKDGIFVERYSGLPLIMFIDMNSGFQPPEYAIRRLVTAGWDVVFSISRLRSFLTSLMDKGPIK